MIRLAMLKIDILELAQGVLLTLLSTVKILINPAQFFAWILEKLLILWIGISYLDV